MMVAGCVTLLSGKHEFGVCRTKGEFVTFSIVTNKVSVNTVGKKILPLSPALQPIHKLTSVAIISRSTWFVRRPERFRIVPAWKAMPLPDAASEISRRLAKLPVA